jgi:lipopolysaccharide export system permease protein
VAEFTTTDTPLGKVSKDIFRPRGDDERELYITELLPRLANPPKGATVNSLRAEFHRRTVSILTMLLLPLLALPFAIGRARSPRAYRIVVALVLLVAFNEVIQQGSLASERNGLSPWLTMWLPLGLLACFALWRFYNASFRLARDGLDMVLQPVQDATSALWRGVKRRLGGGVDA